MDWQWKMPEDSFNFLCCPSHHSVLIITAFHVAMTGTSCCKSIISFLLLLIIRAQRQPTPGEISLCNNTLLYFEQCLNSDHTHKYSMEKTHTKLHQKWKTPVKIVWNVNCTFIQIVNFANIPLKAVATILCSIIPDGFVSRSTRANQTMGKMWGYVFASWEN